MDNKITTKKLSRQKMNKLYGNGWVQTNMKIGNHAALDRFYDTNGDGECNPDNPTEMNSAIIVATTAIA